MPAPTVPAESWVTDRTGARVTVRGQAGGPSVSLALRRNPSRAHLLVSHLLGKHVPTPAGEVLAAAAALGSAVRDALAGPAVVLGFAETATALGHAAAAHLEAPYLHTTRRPAPSGATVVTFDEEHSHAVEQTLAVVEEAALREDVPLVLVDDELSSGRTAVNAIRALHARWPRARYVLASLLDARTDDQREQTRDEVAALGADLASVALLTGAVELPADLLERAADLVSAAPPAEPLRGPQQAVLRRYRLELPRGVPLTGAHGWSRSDEDGLRSALRHAAARLPVAGNVLVLGDEEFMYAGQLLAAALGPTVRTSATTRSPALVVDAPGYPLRTALAFDGSDEPGRAAFAYNVAPSSCRDPGPAPGFDEIVVLLDRAPGPHVEHGLLAQLARAAHRVVHVVQVVPGDGPHLGTQR